MPTILLARRLRMKFVTFWMDQKWSYMVIICHNYYVVLRLVYYIKIYKECSRTEMNRAV